MSLTQIEQLKRALVLANTGALSDSAFQVTVLQGLISLKESHVSLRARLYNVETSGEPEPVQVTEKDVPETYSGAPPIMPGEDELKAARETFNDKSVQFYQRVFIEDPSCKNRILTFNATVELLGRLDFKYYGDGKYPLSHYLRDIVGANHMVAFPSFLQAISISISRPIPLVYKEAFEDMDKDNSGKLDAKEIFNMLQSMSDTEYSWADVEEFIANTDINHDGKMDYAEMLAAFYFNQ